MIFDSNHEYCSGKCCMVTCDIATKNDIIIAGDVAASVAMAPCIRCVTVNRGCPVAQQQTLRRIRSITLRDTSTITGTSASIDVDHNSHHRHIALCLVSRGQWTVFDSHVQLPKAGSVRVCSVVRAACCRRSDCLPRPTENLDGCCKCR